MSSARWPRWKYWLTYELRFATGQEAAAGTATATPRTRARSAAIGTEARRDRKANGLPPLYLTPCAHADGDGAWKPQPPGSRRSTRGAWGDGVAGLTNLGELGLE